MVLNQVEYYFRHISKNEKKTQAFEEKPFSV
jgi:hypothetical protein